MAKLVLMLRVKDGIFFVKEWLERYSSLVDGIVALDNGSTDGTYEILKAHPLVKEIVQTFNYNEGRDKNMMYELARKLNPDWCMWLDVDEIMEPQITRAYLDKLMNRKHVNQFAFRRFHFIDREHFAVSDYWMHYSAGHDRVMWRENPAGYFQDVLIDSPNVKGIKGLKINTDIRLKHTGYINKELVDKKAEIYRAIIPEKEATFQTMYIQNEKRARWHDDKNNSEVKKLNRRLNRIQFYQLFPKAFRKLKRIIFKQKATV